MIQEVLISTKRNLLTNSAEFYNLVITISTIVLKLVYFIDENFILTEILSLKIL